MCSHSLQSVTSVLSYANVISLANLEEASTRLSLENQWTKQSEVSEIDLSKLHFELKRQKYKFRPQKKISVRVADGNQYPLETKNQSKERIFAFPSKRDTVLLTAFAQKLEQVFDPFLSSCSYGARQDRTLHTLFHDLSAVSGKNPVLFRIHLEKSFGKIHQEFLVRQLAFFCDQQGRELFQKVCQASYIDVHTLGMHQRPQFRWSSFETPLHTAGLPRANLLSLVCTNIFFASFDTFLFELQKEYSFRFVRYMDQILCIVSGDLDEKQRIALENRIQRFLLQTLKLSSTIEKTKKVSFLGAQVESSHEGVTCSPDIDSLFALALEKGYAKYGASGKIRATSFRRATSFQEDEIVLMYQKALRRICQYYSWTHLPSSLSPILHLLTKSCALTLADKLKLGSAQKVYKRFGPYLRVQSLQTKGFKKMGKNDQTFSLHPSTYKKIDQKTFEKGRYPHIFSSFFDDLFESSHSSKRKSL